MKNFSAIMLAFVLILPFTGLLILFESNKARIRNEVNLLMSEGIDKKELALLKFTLEEAGNVLEWKHDREFVFKGQMYDIAEMWLVGDSVFYSCYPDHKETKLLKDKDKLVAKAFGQDPTRKKQSERIKNYFQTGFRLDAFSWEPTPSSISCLLSPISYFQYSSLCPVPPAPPPKFG